MTDDADLAYRYRHGWIKLGPDGKDFKPSDPVKTEKALKTLARMRERNKAELAPGLAKAKGKWDSDAAIQAKIDARDNAATAAKVADQVGKQSKAQKVLAKIKSFMATLNEEPAQVSDYKAIMAAQDKAKKEQAKIHMKKTRTVARQRPYDQAAQARAKAARRDLSVLAPDDVDLAFGRPTRRPTNQGRVAAPRPVTGKPKGVSKALVKGFKKSAGVNSVNSAKAVAVLKARAAKPGHYRAKAILAAKRGNTQQAQKFLAKRVVAKAKAHSGGNAVAFKPAKPKKPAHRAFGPRTVRK